MSRGGSSRPSEPDKAGPVPSGTVAMGVVHPHGLRGELKLVLYHGASTLDFRGLDVKITPRSSASSARVHRVESCKRSGPLVYLRLRGIEDRNATELVDGWELTLERASLPAPEDDEVYVADLVGMRVLEGERDVGTVREIRVYPASCCAVVMGERAELEIPVHEPYVVEVDLRERVLHVAHLADLIAPSSTAVDPGEGEGQSEGQSEGEGQRAGEGQGPDGAVGP